MYRIAMHVDSDGFAAAGVVYKHLLSEGVKDSEIEWHPINYGMPIPEEINYEEDTVYMVDFSLQPAPVMVEFAEKLGDRFTWIDHHSTSVSMEEEFPALKQVPGIRQVEWEEDTPIAGCELAWKYFYGNRGMPIILQLIGDWDTWRWPGLSEPLQEKIKALQFHLNISGTNPKYEDGRAFWLKALDAIDIDPAALRDGALLRKYQEQKSHGIMKSSSFEANFAGLRAIMVNQRGGSEMFKGFYDPEKHDVMVTFTHVQGKYVSVGLYGEGSKIHLGELAKKLGHAGDFPSGGGHAGAAGYQCSWADFRSRYSPNEE